MKNQKMWVNFILTVFLSTVFVFNSKAQTKPNIILIYADDISARELPIYGSNVWTDRLGKESTDVSQRAVTPVLDKMATEGCYIETVWAATVCSPSRAMMMTGRYAHIHKWWDNGAQGKYVDPADGVNKTIPLYVSSPKTIGHIAQEGGYATFWTGKHQMSGGNLESFGFDEALFTAGYPEGTGTEDPYTDFIIKKQGGTIITQDGNIPINAGAVSDFTQTSWYWQPSASIMKKNTSGGYDHEWWPNTTEAQNDFGVNTFGPDVELDFVFDFIENKSASNEPFFVYHTTHLGHAQFDFLKNGSQERWTHTPKVAWDATSETYTRTTPTITGDNGVYDLSSITPSGIYNHVNYLDYQMSLYLAKLKELGIDDNTLIIFTADNGTKDYGKSSFDRQKGTHVPFIVYGPGLGITKTGKQDVLLNISDVLPTIAEIAGVTIPDNYEINGESFWPFLTTSKADHRDWIYGYQEDKQIIRDQEVMIDGKNDVFDVTTTPTDLISFPLLATNTTTVLSDANFETRKNNLLSIMQEFDSFATEQNGLPNPSVNGGVDPVEPDPDPAPVGDDLSLIFENNATVIGTTGALDAPIVFTINNIPNGTTNAMNVRVFPLNDAYTGGTQEGALQTGLSLNSNTADVTDGSNGFTTSTTSTTTGFINRTFTISNVPITGVIANGTEYKAVVRLIQGSTTGTTPISTGGSDTPTPKVTGGNGKHIIYALNSLTGDSTLSFDKVVNISNNISPIVATDVINISTTLKTKTYKVYNSLGSLVKDVKATGILHVSDLSSGVYFLVTDFGIAKFIKQ